MSLGLSRMRFAKLRYGLCESLQPMTALVPAVWRQASDILFSSRADLLRPGRAKHHGVAVLLRVGPIRGLGEIAQPTL